MFQITGVKTMFKLIILVITISSGTSETISLDNYKSYDNCITQGSNVISPLLRFGSTNKKITFACKHIN